MFDSSPYHALVFIAYLIPKRISLIKSQEIRYFREIFLYSSLE